MMRLAEYRSKASLLADFLPWAALIGPGIILNKDGSLQRTARFRGPDLDSATPAELVAVSGRLNNALRRLGSGWAVFVEAQRLPARDYPLSQFPDPISALVDAERRAQFEEASSHFESAYFLTFVWMPPADDASRAGRWLYEDAPDKGLNPQEHVTSFTARTDRLLDLLDGFMPEAVWLSDEETLTYLHSTISTRRQRVRRARECSKPAHRSGTDHAALSRRGPGPARLLSPHRRRAGRARSSGRNRAPHRW